MHRADAVTTVVRMVDERPADKVGGRVQDVTEEIAGRSAVEVKPKLFCGPTRHGPRTARRRAFVAAHKPRLPFTTDNLVITPPSTPIFINFAPCQIPQRDLARAMPASISARQYQTQTWYVVHCLQRLHRSRLLGVTRLAPLTHIPPQSSSTISPSTFSATMRGQQSWDRKVEEMKPSKR